MVPVDHSYITSALVGWGGGGGGGGQKMPILLIFSTKNMLRGVQKSQKCDDVIHEWSHGCTTEKLKV